MWMPAVLCSSGLAESVTCTGCMAIVREATARAAQQQREFGNMHTHVQLSHVVLTIVDLRLAMVLFLCVGILGWELHVCGNVWRQTEVANYMYVGMFVSWCDGHACDFFTHTWNLCL